MCLTSILPKNEQKEILDQYPDEELLKGWKVFEISEDEELKAIYRCGSFVKKWNVANTSIGIETSNLRTYKSGYHFFTTKEIAIAYGGLFTIVIPVYFHKTNVTNIGIQGEEITFVTNRLYIKPKDYDNGIKEGKKFAFPPK